MGYDPVYAKRWRVDRERGITRMVDARPARVHVEQLAMEGASYRAIADAAGISIQTVCKIRDGQKTCGRDTAAAILTVTYDHIFNRDRGDKFVPKIGACRRIRALMAIGHRAQDIAAAADMDWHNVHNVINQTGQWITLQRHQQIVTAYDALWDTPGTSRHVLARAKAAGWAPPLAWDDDTIDDPNATPDLGGTTRSDDYVDETAVWRRIDGDTSVSLTNAERREVVRILHSRGLNDGEIERLTRIDGRQIIRDRQRLSLPPNAASGERGAA